MSYWSPAVVDSSAYINPDADQVLTYKDSTGSEKGFLSIKPSRYYKDKRYEKYLSTQVVNADYFVYGLTVVLPVAWQTSRYEIHFLTNLTPSGQSGTTHLPKYMEVIFVYDNDEYYFYGIDGVAVNITDKVSQEIKSGLISNTGPENQGVYEYDMTLDVKDGSFTLYVNGIGVVTQNTTDKLHYANNNVGFLLVPSMPRLTGTGIDPTPTDIDNIGVCDMYVKACGYDVVPIVKRECVFENVFTTDTFELNF